MYKLADYIKYHGLRVMNSKNDTTCVLYTQMSIAVLLTFWSVMIWPMIIAPTTAGFLSFTSSHLYVLWKEQWLPGLFLSWVDLCNKKGTQTTFKHLLPLPESFPFVNVH